MASYVENPYLVEKFQVRDSEKFLTAQLNKAHAAGYDFAFMASHKDNVVVVYRANNAHPRG